MAIETLRLGVNIDHVATLRNARGGVHPDPVALALQAMDGGADGITAHLREDRRHMRDADMWALKNKVPLPLNFEMAATEEMLALALNILPNACCLVPEKRAELTTEGGLDVAGQHNHLKPFIHDLKQAGIRVSLFIDPDSRQVEAAKLLGADIVELHTGRYCEKSEASRSVELQRLQQAATLAHALRLECHAGHGITYETVSAVAAIPEMVELNIGHFLVGEALVSGMREAVKQMKILMKEARG